MHFIIFNNVLIYSLEIRCVLFFQHHIYICYVDNKSGLLKIYRDTNIEICSKKGCGNGQFFKNKTIHTQSISARIFIITNNYPVPAMQSYNLCLSSNFQGDTSALFSSTHREDHSLPTATASSSITFKVMTLCQLINTRDLPTSSSPTYSQVFHKSLYISLSISRHDQFAFS